MTVKRAIELGVQELTAAHTHDPAGCARFLLRHAWKKSVSDKSSVLSFDTTFLSNPGLGLSAECLGLYKDILLRRKLHEPVWYITNEAFFWHDPLYVDGRVLIPRPETELLVEAVLDYVKGHRKKKKYLVIDVGTGSGAIAISLFKELQELGAVERFYATDVSAEAIEVAKLNAKNLGAEKIRFLVGDALAPLKEKVDLIVGNPPYVPTETVGGLSYDIHHFEPRVALDGGRDGLDVHRKILMEARRMLKKGGAIFLEIGYDQGNLAKKLAKEAFPPAKVDVHKDYDGHDRILGVQT